MKTKTERLWHWQYFGGEMQNWSPLPEGITAQKARDDSGFAMFVLVRADGEPVGEAWVPCGEDEPVSPEVR